MITSINGVIQTSEISQTGRLKIVLLGEPGSGKSWLCATAPAPIFIFDFDDRKESLGGKLGVQIKTYPTNKLDSWADFEADLGVLEYLKAQKKLDISTVVLDSATFMSKVAENQTFKDNPNTARSFKVGTKSYLVSKSFDSWMLTRKMIEGAINRLVALDIHVIVTAHIRQEKSADSTSESPKFTGKYTIEPQNLKQLMPSFNERWMMKDGFKVQMKPDFFFNAVTALNVDSTEEPDIAKIIVKHLGRVKKC